MARRKSRRSRATYRMRSPVLRRSRRPSRHLRQRPPTLALSLRPLDLAPSLDRRNWYPDPLERPLTINVVESPRRRSPDRLIAAASIDHAFSRGVPAFSDPKRVSVCVRREERRRVIFAKGRSGRGNRKGKRNALSQISCRRK